MIGVLVLATGLCSCSILKKDKDETASAADGQVRTVPNKEYQSPSYAQPSRRNPDIALPSNFSKKGGVTYSQVRTNEPYIAMTFDDGPHPTNTPRLLDILRERNIKATFYVIGDNSKRYPEILQRMIREGHEIGNHTMSHAYLTKLSDAVKAILRPALRATSIARRIARRGSSGSHR